MLELRFIQTYTKFIKRDKRKQCKNIFNRVNLSLEKY